MEGPQLYRKNLAETLQSVPKSDRKERLEDEKRDPDYWVARAGAVEERQASEEISINDGRGIFVPLKYLYHGSATVGIKDFLPATDTTVGNGLYLTSKAEDAFSYAHERSKYGGTVKMGMEGKVEIHPTVYEVKIENLKLLDLRNDKNVQDVSKKYVEYLRAIIQSDRYKQMQWVEQGAIRKVLERMNQSILGHQPHDRLGAHNLKEIAQWGRFFSEFVASLGYDGLIALEGGEGHGFNHNSYVIFDASKAQLVQEQKINQTE